MKLRPRLIGGGPGLIALAVGRLVGCSGAFSPTATKEEKLSPAGWVHLVPYAVRRRGQEPAVLPLFCAAVIWELPCARPEPFHWSF
jgi:hypothetical protein